MSVVDSRKLWFLWAAFLLFQQFASADEYSDKDSINNLEQFVVTGARTKTDARYLPMTVTVVNSQMLNENNRVSILPTLMEHVPGLIVTSRGLMGYGVSNGGSGGMMLRGVSSTSGQMMVLIDGHPQYNGIYGHSISDSYQTMMADRVEVLRGPASLLYGSNAMGGVVNIVTRGFENDTVLTSVDFGAGSYGTVQAEASNQVKRGKFSSTVAAQYGRTDNHRPNMGFYQYGGFAKLKYDFSDAWNVFVDADVTHFNANNPGSTNSPLLQAEQWITRGVVSAGVENQFNKCHGRLSLYDNFGRHKINDGYSAESGTPQTRLFRSKDALAGIDFFQTIDAWNGATLTLGLDYQHIYGRAYYTDIKTGKVLETQNKQSAHVHNNETAGYVELRQVVTKRFVVDAGLRYDYHNVAGGEWIPQGGLVYKPTANGEIKAMVSKGFRNPTMKEMYLYPPSNEDLKAEKLVNYELSWRHRVLSEKLAYGVNIFHIDAENIIQTVDRKNVNTGELNNNGVEAEATWNISNHWSANTNHSYLKMENPIIGAPTYKGFIGGNYRGGRWNVCAGLMYVDGLYKSVGDDEQKVDFFLLNATVNFMAAKNINLWLKGDNLLGQKYEINAGYPMPKATFMAGAKISF